MLDFDPTVDLYAVLGLDDTASTDEVRAAFRSVAKKHHPDVGGDPVAFRRVSHAKDVLTDPARLASYRLARRDAADGRRSGTAGPPSCPDAGAGPSGEAYRWPVDPTPVGEWRVFLSGDGLDPGLAGWLGRPVLSAGEAAVRAAAAGAAVFGLFVARASFDTAAWLGFGVLPTVSVPWWLAGLVLVGAVCSGPRVAVWVEADRRRRWWAATAAAGFLFLEVAVVGLAAAWWWLRRRDRQGL